MEDALRIIDERFTGKSKEYMLKQLENYYAAKNSNFLNSKKYKIGDDVFLKKGTLLHGTYKNIEGLREIVNNGLISSEFINGRISKYPACVGVWNLKTDYSLKDYINFYSGATIKYNDIIVNNEYSEEVKTDIISYNELPNINKILSETDCRMWYMEQTKEARFMPSLVQNRVQIGIMFDGDNDYIKKLIEYDVLNPEIIDDISVEPFVNPNYYERFLKDRKNKDDFFTDRESAILYGIPSNFIEGILVGREYEANNEILNEIKTIIPNAYICNLDGKVIVE